MNSATAKGTLLVIADERLIRWSIRQRFDALGYQVLEAENCEEGWTRFQGGVDLVVLDQRLPDGDGYDLLQWIVAVDGVTPVIMLLDNSGIDQAGAVMQAGAYHYVGKPCNLDELTILVDRALKSTRLTRRVQALQAGVQAGFDEIIGESPPMIHTKELLAQLAQSPSSPALLTGESGTGKKLAAKMVHQNSERAEGPFLTITGTALTAPLLESELFGHERWALADAKLHKKGLLELAHTGTVLIEEIGEMPADLQVKLLRLLEEKTFRRVGGAVDIRSDVRIIAATSADLQRSTLEQVFREDLYWQLATLNVQMPALRERTGDVERLINTFIARFDKEFNKQVLGVNPAVMSTLASHCWPGNIRQLRNVVEWAVLFAKGTTLNTADFPMLQATATPDEAGSEFFLPPSGIDLTLLERSMVKQALDRARGNRTIAASLLGLNRDQIRYRIMKYNLTDHLPDKKPA